MRPINHAEASSHFIEAKEHLEFHDRRLWDLRLKRDRQAHGIPEWEELRNLASTIKEHTLSHLADYLEQFETQAKTNGANVHWARDASEHNDIVYGILSARSAKTLVKSKSMLTEECDMRPYLETRGIRIIETDLGERIQQLDDEPPSHIVVPAVHKLRDDVSEVFARTIEAQPGNNDPHYLAEVMRRDTRPYFLNAEAGMTGANFAIAETGSFVVCTNEGNADLSANVPKLHIACIGIEKIIPKFEHLAVFIRMLSRSAKTLVKSKSMLTEECDMRPYLETRGIRIIETDLGERIQQLDDEPPSHIVVPAVHKLRDDVSEVFARTIEAQPGNNDPHYLAEVMRHAVNCEFSPVAWLIVRVIVSASAVNGGWYRPNRAE